MTLTALLSAYLDESEWLLMLRVALQGGEKSISDEKQS